MVSFQVPRRIASAVTKEAKRKMVSKSAIYRQLVDAGSKTTRARKAA